MIPVHVYVENPEELLNASAFGAGALLRVEWCATQAGAYAEFASTPIVAATRAYTLYHGAGVTGTWYRTRYSTAAPAVPADYSEYSDPFQSGGSGSGLCDLDDVRQRLGLAATDTTSDEDLAEFIAQVTTDILGHTGREFIGSVADETRTFDVPADFCRTLWVPGGVRSITTLGIASGDQPDSAGTYTTATTGWYLRPLAQERTSGWPATRVELSWTSGLYFYPGRSTVQIVGRFGWSAVPPDIAGIATSAVVRRFQARQSSSTGVDLMVGSADLGFRTLAFLSPSEVAKLNWYREMVVA